MTISRTLAVESRASASDAARVNLAQKQVESSSAGAAPWRDELRGLRIAFAGGGTGGHIAPGRHLLAHARDELGDVLWFCTGRAVEEQAFAGAGFARVSLDLEPEHGGAPGWSRLLLRTWPSIRRARAALREHCSEVLLGLGGFTCLPAVLAARSLGIPVALLEINAAAGRATRKLTPLAARTFHAWRATLPSSGETARDRWTGAPLSPALAAMSAQPSSSARAGLGFAPDRPLLVVLGGSQGARALNEFVAANAEMLVREGVQVLHQTGPGRGNERAGDLAGYRAVEFVRDVPAALAAATAVLCRGGASTLAEIAAARRPAWVVPYPHHADRHQERNARALGDGVQIVDQTALGPDFARELAARLGPHAELWRLERARALERALPLDGAERIWRELATLRRRP